MSERERERRRRGIRGKVIGSVSCLLVHGTNYKTSARMEWSHNYIGILGWYLIPISIFQLIDQVPTDAT